MLGNLLKKSNDLTTQYLLCRLDEAIRRSPVRILSTATYPLIYNGSIPVLGSGIVHLLQNDAMGCSLLLQKHGDKRIFISRRK
jgi:hypothetical protein